MQTPMERRSILWSFSSLGKYSYKIYYVVFIFWNCNIRQINVNKLQIYNVCYFVGLLTLPKLEDAQPIFHLLSKYIVQVLSRCLLF
jgi:hypothetical protein